MAQPAQPEVDDVATRVAEAGASDDDRRRARHGDGRKQVGREGKLPSRISPLLEEERKAELLPGKSENRPRRSREPTTTTATKEAAARRKVSGRDRVEARFSPKQPAVEEVAEADANFQETTKDF